MKGSAIYIRKGLSSTSLSLSHPTLQRLSLPLLSLSLYAKFLNIFFSYKKEVLRIANKSKKNIKQKEERRGDREGGTTEEVGTLEKISVTIFEIFILHSTPEGGTISLSSSSSCVLR